MWTTEVGVGIASPARNASNPTTTIVLIGNRRPRSDALCRASESMNERGSLGESAMRHSMNMWRLVGITVGDQVDVGVADQAEQLLHDRAVQELVQPPVARVADDDLADVLLARH